MTQANGTRHSAILMPAVVSAVVAVTLAVLPAIFWYGAFSHRVTAVEAAQAQVSAWQQVVIQKLSRIETLLEREYAR
jgi:uncharacterized membrane protein YfbV (UPF0208 family)